MTQKPYVLVVGSANIDVSLSVKAVPRLGETVFGDSTMISVGGKGANQAVASAACGVPTQFAARVGVDPFGQMVRDELEQRNVQTSNVKSLSDVTTGLAAIYVEESGQNCIVVTPGANARLAPADTEEIRSAIRDAAIIILQCEIPMETVYRTIDLARESGTPVILNPAPFRGLVLERLSGGVTYLVPNESEASQLWGRPVNSIAEAQECASAIRMSGIECVIITLGAQGCLAVDGASVRHFAPFTVTPVDTTGAGDAFVGCLAASSASGRPRHEAIRRAVVYSALSTTRRGAQLSYPLSEDFEHVWKQIARRDSKELGR
jgi:ribokinase